MLTYAKRTSANGANASQRFREERVLTGAPLCETEALYLGTNSSEWDL